MHIDFIMLLGEKGNSKLANVNKNCKMQFWFFKLHGKYVVVEEL